jgi:hypothetical protein
VEESHARESACAAALIAPFVTQLRSLEINALSHRNSSFLVAWQEWELPDCGELWCFETKFA